MEVRLPQEVGLPNIRKLSTGVDSFLFLEYNGGLMRFTYKKIKIIAREIQSAGGRALIVGGAVRDEVIGIKSKDFDIEVYGMDALKLEKILKGINMGELNAVGRQFGVFKLGDLDISIPRKDSKISEGHRGFVVEGDPTMSVEEAAKRRDLTINSMAKDPITGEVFDPFNGKRDIEQRVLRATDSEHFVEDPLRVLRLMQFSGRFNFSVEEETQGLARSMQGQLHELPKARITEEWKKLLLKSERPSVGLRVARDLGIFEALHPEINALIGVHQERDWHPEGDVFEHTMQAVDEAARIARRERLSESRQLIIIFGALVHDFGKATTTEFKDGRIRSHGHQEAGEEPARSFLRRLEFGKELEEHIVPLVRDHLTPRFLYKEAKKKNINLERSIRRLAKRLGNSSISDLVLVSEADYKGRGIPNRKFYAGKWLLRQAETLGVKEEKSEPILMGRHLIRYLHWEPAPEFGKVLHGVYEAQLDGKVNTLYQAMTYAKIVKRQIAHMSSWGV